MCKSCNGNCILLKEEPFENYSEQDGEIGLLDIELESHLESEINRKGRDYIRWVQRSLNEILGTRLAIDGFMGLQTTSAIRSFQKRQGLKADGIVGSKTEQALITAGADHSQVRPVSPNKTTEPLTSKISVSDSQLCPEPAKTARDRCLNPGTKVCPAIRNLLCVKGVNGIPFEYPKKGSVKKDPATGILVVDNINRIRNHLQRFIPSVSDALTGFVRNMSTFGIPIEAIITAGSIYCRCVSRTNTLSNHSFGDAIDIVGVRWKQAGTPISRLRETIVHNYRDVGERVLLRRINACLRLSFPTVIDYHRTDHRDHFHCDMNRGKKRNPRGKTTLSFVQEALSSVLNRNIHSTGKLDTTTQKALKDFSGLGAEVITNNNKFNETLNKLFARVAAGR